MNEGEGSLTGYLMIAGNSELKACPKFTEEPNSSLKRNLDAV